MTVRNDGVDVSVGQPVGRSAALTPAQKRELAELLLRGELPPVVVAQLVNLAMSPEVKRTGYAKGRIHELMQGLVRQCHPVYGELRRERLAGIYDQLARQHGVPYASHKEAVQARSKDNWAMTGAELRELRSQFDRLKLERQALAGQRKPVEDPPKNFLGRVYRALFEGKAAKAERLRVANERATAASGAYAVKSTELELIRERAGRAKEAGAPMPLEERQRLDELLAAYDAQANVGLPELEARALAVLKALRLGLELAPSGAAKWDANLGVVPMVERYLLVNEPRHRRGHQDEQREVLVRAQDFAGVAAELLHGELRLTGRDAQRLEALTPAEAAEVLQGVGTLRLGAMSKLAEAVNAAFTDGSDYRSTAVAQARARIMNIGQEYGIQPKEFLTLIEQFSRHEPLDATPRTSGLNPPPQDDHFV